MINRISVASIVGENEISGLEMSTIQVPFLQLIGVRARCHVIPRRGHAAPPPLAFDSAYRWLEAAAGDRRRMADARKILRIHGGVSREEFAAAALEDCKSMLDDETRLHKMLGLLEEIKRRWPDVPAAEEAGALMDEYAARDEQPWTEYERLEKLRDARFLAERYEGAARTRSGLNKAERAIFAMTAISNYMVVARDASDDDEAKAAQLKIDELQPLVDKFRVLQKPMDKAADR